MSPGILRQNKYVNTPKYVYYIDDNSSNSFYDDNWGEDYWLSYQQYYL